MSPTCKRAGPHKSNTQARHDPRSAEIAFHMQAGMPFKALAVATRALLEKGETYESLFRLAKIETYLGQFTRAKRTWKQALDQCECVDAYVGLGTVYVQDGAVHKGIAAFKAGLNLEPHNVYALSSLAVAHLYLDDFVNARRFSALALSIDPNAHDARLSRARCEFASGNLHLASRDLEILQKAAFKTQEVQMLQTGILSQSNEHEAALFIAAELCSAHPASTESLKAFRRAYRAFVAAGDVERVNAFLTALETPWAASPVAVKALRGWGSNAPIDVIIPVYNALSEVKACLASVRKSGGGRLGKIILVNDASGPETTCALEAEAAADSGILLVHLDQRLGFTQAVVCGIGHTDSVAFAILNSDTLVPPCWLDRLSDALFSESNIAMVGPMSNTASWQSYGPMFDAQYNFCNAEFPDAHERERLLNASNNFGPDNLVSLPMLHGFCTLINRAAYDAVVGFDRQTYPQGYGETQDLSLRFLRSGYELRLVSDCVVFHHKGASTSTRRREVLSQAARRQLYATYTALNYLCLEMACCENAFIQKARKAYAPCKA